VSAQAQAQKTVAFVLYPGLTPLDLIGPLQVMSALPLIDPSFRTTVVGERMESVPSDTPIRLTPDGVFDDVPNPFAVLVPGGGAPTIGALARGHPRLRAGGGAVGRVGDLGLYWRAPAGVGGPVGGTPRHDPLGVCRDAGAAGRENTSGSGGARTASTLRRRCVVGDRHGPSPR
jgi:hypothetical protein